ERVLRAGVRVGGAVVRSVAAFVRGVGGRVAWRVARARVARAAAVAERRARVVAAGRGVVSAAVAVAVAVRRGESSRAKRLLRRRIAARGGEREGREDERERREGTHDGQPRRNDWTSAEARILRAGRTGNCV